METQIKKYEVETNAIMTRANELSIKTAENMPVATDILKAIKDRAKAIKAEKEKYTKPLNETLKNLRDTFRPLENACIGSEAIIKAKMIQWQKEEEKKAAKKQAKIEADIAKGKIDIVAGAEKMADTEVKKSYEGSAGSVQYRNVKKIVIRADLLPRKYLAPDMDKIKIAVKVGIKIPGVIITIEKQIASL